MATFAILEINGDHISDCDAERLGMLVIAAARNPDVYRYYCDNNGSGTPEVRALRFLCHTYDSSAHLTRMEIYQRMTKEGRY